jgi:hypothetical protein
VVNLMCVFKILKGSICLFVKVYCNPLKAELLNYICNVKFLTDRG